MGSGDIEVVVMQGKASTLKYINTDIIGNNIDKTKHAIETRIQCAL